MEDYIAVIDREIGLYMLDNKLTREKMAELMGISTNTLRWKREGKNDWLLSELVNLSKITGKSLDELTGYVIDPT